MHFHTASEHHIDDMSYPMDMHIVSVDKRAETPHYLVISVPFKMSEVSLFINEFLNQIPINKHGKVDNEISSQTFES